MTAKAYLEHLRAKPEHVRQRIAFWTSAGITLVIFAFWIASFNAFGINAKSTVASAVNKAGSPGQSLVASVGSFFGDLRDLVFGSKKVTYSSVEILPGK